jgi:hypothetical protein
MDGVGEKDKVIDHVGIFPSRERDVAYSGITSASLRA